tara:strand:+ start:2871 stop:4247 length:1377 start_codon:yes stop_codon:yes gene_type:complete
MIQKMYIIDRRLNPKGKSLGNRQRFIKRARNQIKKAVDDAINTRKISDLESSERIRISSDGLHEPHFRPAQDKGHRQRIFPGNKDFTVGDRIKRPPDGKGQNGRNASDSGDGEDSFQFTLTKDEFMDLFFDGLSLPDFIKKSLHKDVSTEQIRAGFRKDGAPANLNLARTMRQSMARRIGMRRPRKKDIMALEEQIDILEQKHAHSPLSPTEHEELKSLKERLSVLRNRMERVPFIDPMDVRYSNFTQQEIPTSQAVMFCLMDVSGSMSERHKDLAKRFFMLLHLFLDRQYKKVDLVFIRHTHIASEVDENAFFYSRETGGTIVSTALEEMLRIIEDRYPAEEWNIYAAQASDGDNLNSDNSHCQTLLSERLLPLCQYFTYIEIWDQHEIEMFPHDQKASRLWQAYEQVMKGRQNFVMKNVSRPQDILPVFHELFSRTHTAGSTAKLAEGIQTGAATS